jgi:hypothetical protein
MAQLIVTIDDDSANLSLIKRAISLLKGVKQVTVSKKNGDTLSSDGTKLKGVSDDVKNLIGIASGLKEDDVLSDERLSYLLNK